MLFGKKQKVKEEIPLMENPVSSESIISLSDNLSEMKNLADAIIEQTELLMKHQSGFCKYLDNQGIDSDAAECMISSLEEVQGYLEEISGYLSEAEKEIAAYKF